MMEAVRTRRCPLPSHYHIGFDRDACLFEVATCFHSVQTNRVDFVAGRFAEAFASGHARVECAIGQAECTFADHPRIARAFGQTHQFIFGVRVVDDFASVVFVFGPSDDDVGVRFDFKQRHGGNVRWRKKSRDAACACWYYILVHAATGL
ncbi:hypothetical protein RB275 [Rhodopirellula baltica SH 1]|uniref:Uncharacterized protein n=1 Tax=Rhodopirellula baltica (strain DSM 10527 / NCIMB 13988 / SH1) TaxID=243090 RepID=Q7UZ08_RHOBA|nr:hypothetical protein RB275 [Rhodopirellula baltica SH 1]